MDKETLIGMVRDYRVALYLVLLVISIILIYPHPGPDGLETNLQFGLDLSGGSWIQLEFQSAVVTFKTGMPIDQFVSDLKTKLDAEVTLVENNRIEIRKGVSEEELREIFSGMETELVAYNPGVTKETADDIKRILENKINSLGTRDAKTYVITGLNGISRYVRIEMAGVSMSQAQEIVGKQGKFEIRIQTTGNETEHVVFGDVIKSVATPAQNPPNSDNWGVSFVLTDEGAEEFRQAAIRHGAVRDPDNHFLAMILDGKTVYSAPLSPDLAGTLQARPSPNLIASTGVGVSGPER